MLKKVAWVKNPGAAFLSIRLEEVSANPFESGSRKVIPATLIYIFCAGRVLMIHRVKKNKDIHKGKWNGVGGKLELNESPSQAAVREILEETGLKVVKNNLKPMGVLTFPSFKVEEHQDWICFVFRIDLSGRIEDYPLAESVEGNLEWIAEDKLLSLPLWEGDPTFLPWVLEKKLFLGTYWYENNKLIRWSLDPLV